MAVKPQLDSTKFQMKAIKHQGYLMVYQWFVFMINECGVWTMPNRISDLNVTAGSHESTNATLSPQTVSDEISQRPVIFQCCFGTWTIIKKITQMYGALKFALIIFFIQFVIMWQDVLNYLAMHNGNDKGS